MTQLGATIQGFRCNLTDSLVANCPGFGLRRELDLALINGYLGSLHVLRMEALPPAYARSPEVHAVQDQITAAIARIVEWRDTEDAVRNVEDDIEQARRLR